MARGTRDSIRAAIGQFLTNEELDQASSVCDTIEALVVSGELDEEEANRRIDAMAQEMGDACLKRLEKERESAVKTTDMHLDAFIKIDVTSMLDQNGDLTEEGRARLRVELIEKLIESCPEAERQKLEAAADDLIARNSGPKPKLLRKLATIATELRELDLETMNLGRAYHEAEGPGAGPHTFLCGVASGKIEAAYDLLNHARNNLARVFSCEEDHDAANYGDHGPN